MATNPSLIEVYKTHPVHVPTNKNLDSLKQLPDTYDWIQPDSFPSFGDSNNVDVSNHSSIPFIDLSLPNAPDLVCNAFRTWGVFQVVSHGVPISLLDSIESLTNALFDLPSSQKLKAARAPDGISGYGLARISTFFPKLMWSEGFTIVGSPLEFFQKLWPQDYSKHCDIIEEFECEVKRLCGRLMWIALGELGISRKDVEWAGPDGDFKANHSATQLNCYPVCPNPDRAMGLGAHTDTNLLTILYQNNARGLQVLKEGKKQWVTVEPIPGALVVQVGDLLHILTNGLYPSPVHQAVVNQTRKRLSIAYFFGPPESAEISPHKKLVGPTTPPLYPTVTWTQYLRKKAELFNDTLSSIRIICTPVNGPLPLDVNDHNQVKVG